MSSGDPDVSFECIQEPSERTIGGRRRQKSDAVFDDVIAARAPIASTSEVHALDTSPTVSGRVSPTEVTPTARLRPVLRSKPPPAPPLRSSSLVSSPSSTATECTASTQRSPRQSASPSSPSTHTPKRQSVPPSPRGDTNGIPLSSPEGIVNPAFRPSVSLEKQVSEFFAPTAMDPEGDDNDDIWKLMGFKLSELCRVILKEPEEAEEGEPTEEEREVKPLSTTTAEAEPIRERQRVSEISRKIPPTNTGESVTCVRGGSTGVTDDMAVAASPAFGCRPETTSRVDVDDVSGMSGHRATGATRRDGAQRYTAPVDVQRQHKPVAFVSPFTADSCHDREQMHSPDCLRRGAAKQVCSGRLADDGSNHDTITGKAGEELAYPFLCQNAATGRTPGDVGAGTVNSGPKDDTRSAIVVGSVSGNGGENILLNHSDCVRVVDAKSHLNNDRNTLLEDTQQTNSNDVGGGISGGKKQKSAKSRDAKKEKKKGKKHKKEKQVPRGERPPETGSIEASEQTKLREASGVQSNSTYVASDSHDVMYSEGIIEIPVGEGIGKRDLSNAYNQTNGVDVNPPIGGAATIVGRSAAMEEMQQHNRDVDKYVREIETQHYGGDVAASSEHNSCDVTTTDNSDITVSSNSVDDNSSVRSNGSTIATTEIVTNTDVTTPDVTTPDAAMSESYVDPVRRPARTKRGKLRQIVDLNRSRDEHQVVEIQVVPCGHTDIQALIESTEAINVDALVDQSLRQCLASMVSNGRPTDANNDTDTPGERELTAAKFEVTGVEGRDGEMGVNDNGEVEIQGHGSAIQHGYQGHAVQLEPCSNQRDVNGISEQELGPGNTLANSDRLELVSASDNDTGVIGTPTAADNDTRRASESFSDDIVFDEGFRMDDARELEREMDGVSDEISLTSFNTVIAVEATVTDTEAKQTGLGAVTSDEPTKADGHIQGNRSPVGQDAMTEVASVDEANMAISTSVVSDSNNTSTCFETEQKPADAGATEGTKNVNVDMNCEMTSEHVSVQKVGRAYTRSSSLPQSERSERFEYKIRSQVVENNRSSSENPRGLSRSQSAQQIDRCESFECEVRKQLQCPCVTSGDQGLNGVDPAGTEATPDERVVENRVSLSRDSSTPESDKSAEIELRIIESDDDSDTMAAVTVSSRDTHARLYTLENTSDDYDVIRQYDDSRANGRCKESGAWADDATSDFEEESATFNAAETRDKTVRAPVGDVIMFNERAGNARTRTHSGERAASSHNDDDDATPAGDSAVVIVTNGDDRNDVIIYETNISHDVTTDAITEYSADSRRDDVTSTSDDEGAIRGACWNETMLPFHNDATYNQNDPTFQNAKIPGGCSTLITPIIVITEYCDPTPDGASYDGYVGVDDCPSRDYDINFDENAMSDEYVETVSEGDHIANQCEQNDICKDKPTTEQSKGDNGENHGEVTPDRHTGALDDNANIEQSTSNGHGNVRDASSDDVVSDNGEDDATADLPADDDKGCALRRRHVGGASVASESSDGATTAEQMAPPFARANQPDGAVAVPHQPEPASATASRHGHDFLNDLLVEKVCLEGFFSNIGMCHLMSR